MIYRYRCSRKIKGIRHYCRISLPKPIEEYKRPPKCPECKTIFSYRDKSKRAYNRKIMCTCDGMPDNFQHRKGTRMNIEGKGLFFCNHRELTDEEQQELYESRG